MKKPFEVIGNIPGLTARPDGFLYNAAARDPVKEIITPKSKVVYRYTKREYVKRFFEKGELRINLAKNYVDIHDSVRCDAEEGKIEFQIPKNGYFRGNDGIAVKLANDNENEKTKVIREVPVQIKVTGSGFIFCTSATKSDFLKRKFGGAGFAINDIPKFTEIVSKEINKQYPIHDVVVDKVMYTKKLVPPTSLFGPRSVLFQKNEIIVVKK